MKCGHKVRHPTLEDANLSIRNLGRAKGNQGEMFAYECPYCECYHTGHSRRLMRRRKLPPHHKRSSIRV